MYTKRSDDLQGTSLIYFSISNSGLENVSFIAVTGCKGGLRDVVRRERRKINVLEMKVNQYGCPRMWKKWNGSWGGGEGVEIELERD